MISSHLLLHEVAVEHYVPNLLHDVAKLESFVRSRQEL